MARSFGTLVEPKNFFLLAAIELYFTDDLICALSSSCNAFAWPWNNLLAVLQFVYQHFFVRNKIWIDRFQDCTFCLQSNWNSWPAGSSSCFQNWILQHVGHLGILKVCVTVIHSLCMLKAMNPCILQCLYPICGLHTRRQQLVLPNNQNITLSIFAQDLPTEQTTTSSLVSLSWMHVLFNARLQHMARYLIPCFCW